jgi:hypothetical protein
MQQSSNEKIGQNRRKLVKLAIMVFVVWLLTLFNYFRVLSKFGTLDEFVWQTYIEGESFFYMIFVAVFGYIWVLGSLLVLIIGIFNLISIKRSGLEYKLVDFLIVLFPLSLYAIRLLVDFPIFETNVPLPIY